MTILFISPKKTNHLYSILIVALSASFHMNTQAAPHIDRTPSDSVEVSEYEQFKGDLDYNRQATNDHDDSIGRRQGGDHINGVVTPTPPDNGNSINNEIAPIDCTHAAYITLCEELDDKIKKALNASSGNNGEPEETLAWQLLYDLQISNTTKVFDLPHGTVAVRYKASDNSGNRTVVIEKGMPTNNYYSSTSVSESTSYGTCLAEASAIGSVSISDTSVTFVANTNSGRGTAQNSSGQKSCTAYATTLFKNIYVRAPL